MIVDNNNNNNHNTHMYICIYCLSLSLSLSGSACDMLKLSLFGLLPVVGAETSKPTWGVCRSSTSTSDACL